MSTLRELIDAYHARQAARSTYLTGDAGAGTSDVDTTRCCEAENLVLSSASASPTLLAPTTFGSVLMRYRSVAGLSRPKLARILQVDPSYVWLMERGKRLPSYALVLRISDVLGLGSMQRTKLMASAGFEGKARWVS